MPLFVTVEVFDDHDRAFHLHDLKLANIQAIGPVEELPVLNHPDGLRCRKVTLLTGLWYYVKESDADQIAASE